VNVQTRAKVLELASRMGYRPLRMNGKADHTKHLQIGVLIQTDVDPTRAFSQSQFLAGMSEAAYELDVAMTVHTVGFADRERVGDPQRQPMALREGLVAGAILIHSYPAATVESLCRQLPLLVIHNRYDGLEHDYVGVTNARSVTALVGHLHELGHRRIGFVKWHDEGLSWHEERLGGYLQGLMKYGLDYDPSLILPFDETGRSASEAIAAHLQQGIQAWVCANDTVAHALTRQLGERDIVVGRDVSLTGFDAEPTPAGCIKLTTIRENYEAVGAEAVRRLVRRIRQPLTPRCEVLFPCELIIGKSTREPAKRI
jgi:LacI family transcriptional regulator